jgi:hypothetical protein
LQNAVKFVKEIKNKKFSLVLMLSLTIFLGDFMKTAFFLLLSALDNFVADRIDIKQLFFSPEPPTSLLPPKAISRAFGGFSGFTPEPPFPDAANSFNSFFGVMPSTIFIESSKINFPAVNASELDNDILILKELPSNFTYNDMNATEREALENIHEYYVTPARTAGHTAWYYANLRGAPGTGYGTAFVVMHRALLRQIQNIGSSAFKMPTLTPGEVIPDEFLPGTVRQISAIPKYLTLEGEEIYGQQASLNTIDNLDKLGCLLTFLDMNWHLSLGGDMKEIDKSITDKLFWPLHALFDSIVDQWLETEKGKLWAINNPNHPIFSPTADPMTYTNQFFSTEYNGCNSSPDNLCMLIHQEEQKNFDSN